MGLADRLHQKGWSSAEIEHAMAHLAYAEEHKQPLVKFTDASTYWILVFVSFIGIVVFSRLFYPFLAELPPALQSLSIVFIAIVGAVFGILFAHVLHNLDELQHSHHAFMLFLAVGIALAASYAWFNGRLLFGAVFAAMFSAQYIYYWWKK